MQVLGLTRSPITSGALSAALDVSDGLATPGKHVEPDLDRCLLQSSCAVRVLLWTRAWGDPTKRSVPLSLCRAWRFLNMDLGFCRARRFLNMDGLPLLRWRCVVCEDNSWCVWLSRLGCSMLMAGTSAWRGRAHALA